MDTGTYCCASRTPKCKRVDARCSLFDRIWWCLSRSGCGTGQERDNVHGRPSISWMRPGPEKRCMGDGWRRRSAWSNLVTRYCGAVRFHHDLVSAILGERYALFCENVSRSLNDPGSQRVRIKRASLNYSRRDHLEPCWPVRRVDHILSYRSDSYLAYE